MELRAGQRLSSVVCDAQVVVVRTMTGAADLRCGGVPMVDPADSAAPFPVTPTPGSGPELGKRYVDEVEGVELLCTRAGTGALTIGDRPLTAKGAKPLPSSD